MPLGNLMRIEKVFFLNSWQTVEATLYSNEEMEWLKSQGLAPPFIVLPTTFISIFVNADVGKYGNSFTKKREKQLLTSMSQLHCVIPSKKLTPAKVVTR